MEKVKTVFFSQKLLQPWLLRLFYWKKVKTVDFTETVAACDLKVGKSRHLIEYMKVCEY